MCGRYTLANPKPAGFRSRFGIEESVDLSDEEPRYNIAPTDPVLAVRRTEAGARDLGRLRWGLVPGRWAERRSGPPLINARAESLPEQPAFAESFRERRCLIPADGFYEWRRDPGRKVPIW
jgi:putative SOS response-associated peptidase YedK